MDGTGHPDLDGQFLGRSYYVIVNCATQSSSASSLPRLDASFVLEHLVRLLPVDVAVAAAAVGPP